MFKFDLIVIGNGAIGTFIASDLIMNNPKMKIAVIGSTLRPNSASAAAGAMINVFAEMEKPFSESMSRNYQKYLNLGINGTLGWTQFLEKNKILEDVLTAKDTLVYLKDGASDFETSNYNEMVRTAQEYEVYQDYSVSDFVRTLSTEHIPIQSVTKLKGEYSIDSNKLLFHLDNLLNENKVLLLNEKATSITSGEKISVITDRETYYTDKVVIAAGSETSNLLKDYALVPMLQGVGSAYHFKTTKSFFPKIFRNNVIRTVNRGGAQCGFHVLPKTAGFYLGAGNYITFPGESSHRLETLRYLFQVLEVELIGRELSYELIGKLVKGHRPRSIDGIPMIGEINNNPNIFIATGTNRAGLTWAPCISKMISDWINGEINNNLDDSWKPDRSLVSFGNPQEAITYFVESRIGAAIEHKLISNDSESINQRKSELKTLGEKFLAETSVRFSQKDFVLHPDHWAPVLESKFQCY